ncbi:MAG: TIGR03905 family TSCPD domain-containing protein [Clostridia bacterium]|nr:TIGR03905 family TSCPD domain-containing protein [Clostridia bacterium]
MKRYVYQTRGTCARQIAFSLDDTILHDVVFTFGCGGNTQGVARLAEGLEMDRVIELLKDIDCNGRGTSCPAQLATALRQVKDGVLKPVE